LDRINKNFLKSFLRRNLKKNMLIVFAKDWLKDADAHTFIKNKIIILRGKKK